MQGTPGVSLLVAGCVALVVLAAPAVLLASEEPVAPPEQVEPTQPAPPELDEGTAPQLGDEGTPPEQLEPVTNSAKDGARADARAAATRTVVMRNIKFNPRNITIDPGDTVRWENEDSEKHNAIGENGKFETPVIGKGESSQHTFNSAGRIKYFCSLHANMDGTITVGSSGGGGGGGSGGSGGGRSGGGSGEASGGSAGTSSGGAIGATSGGAGSTFGSSSTGDGSSSSLPATGEDLPWLALLGYGVLALGALLRLFVFSRE